MEMSASVNCFSLSFSSTDKRSFSAEHSRINSSTSAVKNRAVFSRLGYDLDTPSYDMSEGVKSRWGREKLHVKLNVTVPLYYTVPPLPQLRKISHGFFCPFLDYC